MATPLLVLVAALFGGGAALAPAPAQAPVPAQAPAPAPPPAPADDRGAAAPAATHADEPLQPLPPGPDLDPRKVALGRRLFHDPRLSRDGRVSCATCHPLDRGGADGLAHSIGSSGAEAAVNTPTVYNVAFNFRYNWSGEYRTL